MAAAGFTLPKIPTEIDCPPGDIFDIPTKADLVNLINKIGDIPSKLRVWLVQLGDEITAELEAMVEDIIKEVEKYMELFEKILSPYWKGGTIRNWSKEAKEAITDLLAEFHMYIPAKILELIGKIIPVSFKFNVIGIDVDLLKITTKEEQERIIAQLSGMGSDIQAKIDALKIQDPPLSAEELKKQMDGLVSGEIDKFFKMIPSVYQQFAGEYGLTVNEWKAKATWSWVKSEIQDWIQNYQVKLFKKLISIFDIIWKALGLPSLTAFLTMDIPKMIQAVIDTVKLKYGDLKKLTIDEAKKFREELKSLLLDLKIGPFSIKEIIGDKIEESVTSLEDEINELIVAARDFSINWQKKLLFSWVKIIKAFLDAIGLGAIFELVGLSLCDFLKMLGFPFKIDIKLPSVSKLATVGLSIASVGAIATSGILSGNDSGPEFDTTSIVRTVNSITTTVGQTIIEGSYTDGEVTVINQADMSLATEDNPLTAFTAYTVADGNIVLNSAASEGDKFTIIPTPT